MNNPGSSRFSVHEICKKRSILDHIGTKWTIGGSGFNQLKPFGDSVLSVSGPTRCHSPGRRNWVKWSGSELVDLTYPDLTWLKRSCGSDPATGNKKLIYTNWCVFGEVVGFCLPAKCLSRFVHPTVNCPGFEAQRVQTEEANAVQKWKVPKTFSIKLPTVENLWFKWPKNWKKDLELEAISKWSTKKEKVKMEKLLKTQKIAVSFSINVRPPSRGG